MHYLCVSLGNCWFIAGAATLATQRELFDKVVPPDQTFDAGGYAGTCNMKLIMSINNLS